MINPSLIVIASWAVAVAQALDVRGIDSTAIFSEAGIDLATARDPGMRYPADRMTIVYELAEDATQDPSFGLSIAEFIHPTSLNALGYSLVCEQGSGVVLPPHRALLRPGLHKCRNGDGTNE